MKLWLDDQREPPSNDWIWIKSSKEFAHYLGFCSVNRFTPDDVSFDFDLGISADGYECAVLLIQFCKVASIPLPKMECHSQNPIGRERIERLIAEA
jgi:hypothetical protein